MPMRFKSRRSHRRAADAYDAFLKRRNPTVAAIASVADNVCYDAASGRLVGAAPYGGLVVELVELFEETTSVRVRHGAFQGGEAIVALCTDDVGGLATPRTSPPVTGSLATPLVGCCIDEATGRISCSDGPMAYLDGKIVPAGTMACADDENGNRICVVSVGDGQFSMAACPQPQDRPEGCCYDVASGTIVCPGSEARPVSLITMAPQPDGSIMAMVDAPDLPDDLKHLPICAETPPPGCCYDATTETLTCPGSDLDGVSAGIVAAWEAQGQVFVWAVWDGGGARMPLCPGQTECPPVFCCVNMQTMQYVCPGVPSLNGTAAPVTEIVTDDGYTWGVLEDGTKMPLCGHDCPPPQTCPECPACPRGLWMSPDGTCVDVPPPKEPECPPCETCPRCPPGMLLDTATGRCVPVEHRPPDEYCPPWWKLEGHCCENCALGRACSDCPDDCDCKKSAPVAELRPMGRLVNPGGLATKQHLSKVVLGPIGSADEYATDPGCPSGQIYCGSPQNANDPPICCDPQAVPPGYRMLTRREVRKLRRIGVLPPENNILKRAKSRLFSMR